MTRRRTWSASFVASTAGFFALAMGIASAAFWPIYGDSAFVIMAVVAIIAGAAIAIFGAWFRWSSPILLAVTLVVYLLIGVPVAVPSQTRFGFVPTLEGFRDLVVGTALGWKQLLTIALPVGSYQSLLVPAFVVIFVSTVVGLTVAIRSKRAPLAVLFPIAVFIVALAFGPGEATPALVLALALFVVVLSWLAWERWYRRRESIRALSRPVGSAVAATSAGAERIGGFRTALSAMVILALAIGVGGAAAATSESDRDRAVLRDAIEQPFDPRDYPSPLSSLRKYHQTDSADATMLSVTALPENSRIRLASLDTYDGVVFSVGTPDVASASGSFTRLPTAIQRDVPARGAEKTIDVEIVGYSGVWMPSVGLLSSVNFTGDSAGLRDSFYYNALGNTAVVVGGVERGDTYTVDSVVVSDLNPEVVSQLTPGTAVVPEATAVPDELTVALDAWVRDAETPGERLTAMLTRMSTDGYISHGGTDEPLSRSGHGADRIEELLTAPRMIGDEEQYAVTAALMARAIGFPSRVVFGFAPENGATRVIGSDVSAWIEVDTAQQGWVAIDPTPPVRQIPEEEPEDPAQVARPQSPIPPPVAEQNTRPDQIPLDSEQEDEEAQDPLMAILLAALAVLGVIALVVFIVLSPFLLIGAAKMRRRYLRQRAATSALRISGGWQEFEDLVLDYGYEPPASATRSEVAETVGGIQPLVLASVADRAVFAPEHADDDEVRQVWLAVDELGAGLAHNHTRWQRIKAVMSLRSLGGYRVKGLFARERRLP